MLKDKNWLPLSFYSIDNFLSSWRKEKAIKKSFNDFTKEELEYILRRFYVKARSHNGKYYSRNSIRVGLDRYLNNENINFSIITDIEFKVADDAMNAHLIEPDREGKIRSMKHKPALVRRDVELLHEKKLLGLETPESRNSLVQHCVPLRKSPNKATATNASQILKGPRKTTKRPNI